MSIPSKVTNLFNTGDTTLVQQLQAIKDQPDFSKDMALVFLMFDGLDSTFMARTVNVGGIEWDIISPPDRSMFIAVTKEIGADNSSHIWRQYVMPDEQREPVLATDERWWYIPLDGFDLDVRPATNEHAAKVEVFYDLMFLHMCDGNKLEQADRIVLTRITSANAYGGMVYNRRDGKIKLKSPNFNSVGNEATKFDNLTPGYYWLEEPGKEKTVVCVAWWVSTDGLIPNELVFYYTSNVSSRSHVFRELALESKLTKID